MKLITLSPKKSLNKAFLKQRPLRSEIDLFKNNLLRLLSNIDIIEREENQKNHISNFLRDTYYKNSNEINTKESIDLVIHTGKSNKDSVGVIIETKRPSNKNEMISETKPNSKAFQELVLYYLNERIENKNNDIKFCIATNIYEWYIFESSYFEKLFYRNKEFVQQYKDWKAGNLVIKDTYFFYNDIAKPFIDSIEDEIPCTYFDIRDYDKILKNSDSEDDKNLIALYKILSPIHLLKVHFADDSNKLDENFYKELLYIIGLEEVKEGNKHVIGRKKLGKRNSGSLLENAINILETESSINKVSDSDRFGKTIEDKYFNSALELCITWINRILFLKLLEAQLVNYHNGNKEYKFLTLKSVNDYDELYRLFHQVLAKIDKDRIDVVKNKFLKVPYLNSSLFEISELEDQTIKINSLDNSATLDLINTTILKDIKKKTDKLPALEYLFKFLDAYDFASEGKEDIQDDNKTLVNSSVLGKVYEKINGYKDGSIFTPGFITMYMCRQAIRLAVVKKFKDKYNWNVEKFEDLKNFIADRKSSNDILEFNELINTLRICDPAVGSGHYLVSSLNEIIAIKWELGIFADEYGRRLTDYEIEVLQDELIITDNHGDIFEYKILNGKPVTRESQRFQRTLFHEKQTIIENCLFGVDINQNSVKICRLRLWIELLKNAYYKEETEFIELETLPNIDINIKCGNSLISRFPIDANLNKFGQKERNIIEEYKKNVREYKNEKNRDKKKKLEEIIQSLKKDIKIEISKKEPKLIKLINLKGELDNLENQTGLFELSKKDKKEQIAKKKRLESELENLTREVEDINSNSIFKNAFEWRFEFPEILDENGNFIGFDVVIGNPPYIRVEQIQINQVTYYKEKYFSASGKFDISSLFIEKALLLLKPKYFCSYISTYQFLYTNSAIGLRKLILEKSKGSVIMFSSDNQIFEGSTTYTGIFLFISSSSNEFNIQQGIVNNHKIEVSGSIILNEDNFTSSRVTVANTNIWDKLQKLNKIKKGIAIGQAKCGVVTSCDTVFYIKDELIKSKNMERSVIYPILGPENLNKYFLSKPEIYCIYPYKNLDGKTILIDKNILKSDLPNIYKYFKENEAILRNRSKGRDNYMNSEKWYQLNRPREKWIYDSIKIIYQGTTQKGKFAIDFEKSLFRNARLYSFILNDNDIEHYKCLLGILNSKLCNYLIKLKCPPKNNNYFELSTSFLENFPFVSKELLFESKIKIFVDEILELKKHGKDISVLEDKIDKIVYKLYDLTDTEIKIIEDEIN